MKTHRRLKQGEIIRNGDEVETHLGGRCVWVLAVHCIGKPAPDPTYTSHRQYRREKTDEA